MTHLKRNQFQKFWPISRKGTKYLALSTHNQTTSIPILIVARDIIKIIKTKKELKKVISEKNILINNNEIRETNYPVCLFDIIKIGNKFYKTGLSKEKKLVFNEISEKESNTKPFKIIGKKILGKDKIQYNLLDGRNLVSKEKANTGDTMLYNFKTKKPEKIISLEKGKNCFVISGAHAGIEGKIENILERGGKKLARILKDNEKINVWTRNIVVVE